MYAIRSYYAAAISPIANILLYFTCCKVSLFTGTQPFEEPIAEFPISSGAFIGGVICKKSKGTSTRNNFV